MMDEEEVLSVDDIDIESRPDSPQEPDKRTGTGLTLVLPSLKSLQQAKGIKKGKSKAAFTGYVEEKPKKPPRPAKLKPLKEVLTKLIANIKKKDDYGFFLVPVNLEQVPGYTDVVKNPMDFGTITNKVARGKYRSLDDFTNDVRLVTSNAKLFNPPGTIYHTEAEKLEIWALDHIEKASGTVIQYELDWNLDPEKDNAGEVNVDDDNNSIVPSAASADMSTPGPSDLLEIAGVRRSTRGPYRKTNATNTTTQKGVLESIDAEGRLPGSKDGLGAFPPGSDLAKTMLDLKLKGKRYKTKKERMRIEKEGPPFRSDASLDYYNMEDPFLVFMNLVPTPFSRPLLTPIYTSPSTSQSQTNVTQSLPNHPSKSQTPQPSSSFPIPTTVPINRPLYKPIPHKGRHWVVTRNTNYRRGKDKEDEMDDLFESDWKASREAHALDFGSFALLAGELAEEMKRRGIPGDDEQMTAEIIKESLDCGASATNVTIGASVPRDASQWFTTQAPDAEDYIRDVVYGGTEGFAYVRSLAEFVTPPEDIDGLDDTALGAPLLKWVENNVIDPLTGNRHSLLRETARQLSTSISPHSAQEHKSHDPVSSQISRSLHVYPKVYGIIQLLLQLRTHTIDMGSLIRAPDEIYQSEKEWFGNLASGEQVKKEDSMEVDTQASPNTSTTIGTMEQLDRVFSYVGNAITALDRQRRAQNSVVEATQMKVDDTEEDPVLRNIRLNLLALAKRAPLDTIALLPRDLIPEQIRHVIPALASAT